MDLYFFSQSKNNLKIIGNLVENLDIFGIIISVQK
jgi:hypothetical protein